MYERLFRHVLFPGYETLLKRRGTARYLSQYQRSQWLGGEALQRLQLDKLNALLAHCWAHVPLLQRHWRAHGLAPGPLASVDEIACYPTVTKALIKDHYADAIAGPWRGRTLSKTTGGSTGDPFRFEYTMDSYAQRTAVMWRAYAWAGAGLGARTAYLWGTGQRKAGWGAVKDRLYHGAFNRRFFDVFSMREDTIDRYIEEMARYRPQAVVGYVAPVVMVARRMIDTGRRLEGLRGVLTGAEALYEPERRLIEQAFGCPVFNTYGSREVMLMAAECERHEGLHVSADHLLLETLDGAGRPVREGSGDVSVTDLSNYGMPLVRYLNGDRATYAARACSCGRGLPLLASIDGRVLEAITTPDGRPVPGEFFVYAILDWPQIRQWQLVQTAVDALEYRVVTPTPLSPDDRARLTAKVRTAIGEAMRLSIVEVDAIETSASGKRRLTIALPADQRQAAGQSS